MANSVSNEDEEERSYVAGKIVAGNSSEITLNNEHSSSDDSSLPLCPLGSDVEIRRRVSSELSEVLDDDGGGLDDKIRLESQGSSMSECELMKERFSKLLLGEDMSGCGNGVSTALAISNAITNLCATLFGQVWRLEPLPHEKKLRWRREMEWLLAVSDHIVELTPSSQTFPDGTKLEVMTSRPRSDLYINLPALRKLDNMLLESLDCFVDTEFWYVDQGIVTPEGDGSSAFGRPLPHQEHKWWLPVPRVPPGGLSEEARKMLQQKRDCTNQILKAAMAINSAALAEMDIPNVYLEALPKNGKLSLGDVVHRCITSDQFSPESLLDCLKLSSDHSALEIANKVEAAVHVWRRKTGAKPGSSMANAKTSWEMIKGFVSDVDKRELLADKAESLLLCLKQRFPGLPQTALDTCKIQYNKDVGKSILESYSRVLESLAFNIVARIDDLVYVDDLCKHSDPTVSIAKVGVVPQKELEFATPLYSSPCKMGFTPPVFSPSQLISPTEGKQRLLHIHAKKYSLGWRRILKDDPRKGKEMSRSVKSSDSSSVVNPEMSAVLSLSAESSRDSREAYSPQSQEIESAE